MSKQFSRRNFLMITGTGGLLGACVGAKENLEKVPPQDPVEGAKRGGVLGAVLFGGIYAAYKSQFGADIGKQGEYERHWRVNDNDKFRNDRDR